MPRKFPKTRIWAHLYSLYCFTESMNDCAMPDNASFFKFTKFSKTRLLILGMMPKKVLATPTVQQDMGPLKIIEWFSSRKYAYIVSKKY